jgi:hypothetical protein
MITLNYKKFAANGKEMIDSLFTGKSTCVGYYRAHKKSISLFDHQRNKIGIITNNVLGSARKLENGQYWYSYGTPTLIGEYNSFKAYTDEIQAITKQFNLQVTK